MQVPPRFLPPRFPFDPEQLLPPTMASFGIPFHAVQLLPIPTAAESHGDAVHLLARLLLHRARWDVSSVSNVYISKEIHTAGTFAAATGDCVSTLE